MSKPISARAMQRRAGRKRATRSGDGHPKANRKSNRSSTRRALPMSHAQRQCCEDYRHQLHPAPSRLLWRAYSRCCTMELEPQDQEMTDHGPAWHQVQRVCFLLGLKLTDALSVFVSWAFMQPRRQAALLIVMAQYWRDQEGPMAINDFDLAFARGIPDRGGLDALARSLEGLGMDLSALSGATSDPPTGHTNDGTCNLGANLPCQSQVSSRLPSPTLAEEYHS